MLMPNFVPNEPNTLTVPVKVCVPASNIAKVPLASGRLYVLDVFVAQAEKSKVNERTRSSKIRLR